MGGYLAVQSQRVILLKIEDINRQETEWIPSPDEEYYYKVFAIAKEFEKINICRS